MAVTKVDSVTTAGGVAILTANAQRKGFIIENSDANRLHLRLGGGTVSTTSYSFSLAQNENASLQGFNGDITGIWAADGSGSAFITEY